MFTMVMFKKENLRTLAFFSMLVIPTIALAQTSADQYRQAQTRMLEPMQEVFVRPLVVDLEIIKEERQTYTAWPWPVDVQKMSVADVTNAKINALYMCAKSDNADVIVAPTFFIESDKKGKCLMVTVEGYPARYKNWKVATKEEDYQWIEDVYGTKIRVQNSTKALGDNAAKSQLEESR